MIFQTSRMSLKDFINDRKGYSFLNSILKDRGKSLLNEFYHYNPVTEPFSTSIIWGRWGRQMAGDVKRPQMAVTEPPWLLLNPPWS